MCFSAGASFTAGVLLTAVGMETLRKVHKPSQIVFASITVFFALQQFTEGVLWLVITRAGYAGIQAIATCIFIVMAQVIWPVMIPVSVLLMEKNKTRKRILFVLLAAGTSAALYGLYNLVFHPVHAEISGMHIIYKNNFNNSLGLPALLFYMAVTVIPFFVSGIKRMYVLGIVMGLSFIAAAVFYMQYVTSVWCFFAAVVSFVIFYMIRDSHKKFHLIKEIGKEITKTANKIL